MEKKNWAADAITAISPPRCYAVVAYSSQVQGQKKGDLAGISVYLRTGEIFRLSRSEKKKTRKLSLDAFLARSRSQYCMS